MRAVADGLPVDLRLNGRLSIGIWFDSEFRNIAREPFELVWPLAAEAA
jgi:hypothetical protein